MVAAMGESQAARAKGLFLVLDGTEGCGKSTQVARLSHRLCKEFGERGIATVRDPGTTIVGDQIRSILLNPDNDGMNMRCEMLLYMAARAEMMANVILPSLDAGNIVVCDRFVSSTLAYQLGGDGLTEREIRAVADVAIRGRWPDLTILLDMPAAASLGRVKRQKDRIEQRPIEYHEQVRKNYLAQAAADPARYKVVPADRDERAVHQDVWAAVAPLL
jgi:dTMP kinase